jgi:4a-hydroxytetrahydrobiopterin dehydratase
VAEALANKTCVPCMGGVPPMELEKSRELLAELRGWSIIDEHHLEKEFSFPDFKGALAFVNRAGQVSESEGHHPELVLSWGKVVARIWTHKVDGLTESDFILAAKFDQLEVS